jgi:cytochrome P450
MLSHSDVDVLTDANLRQDTILPRGGGPTGSSPVFIPKGSEILLSFHALHRRKDIWGNNADDFIPERWSTIYPAWSFLPFSAGPRVCPGQRRALTECAYITARLLQSASKVESRDDQPFEEFLRATMQNARGVLVGVFA